MISNKVHGKYMGNGNRTYLFDIKSAFDMHSIVPKLIEFIPFHDMNYTIMSIIDNNLGIKRCFMKYEAS